MTRCSPVLVILVLLVAACGGAGSAGGCDPGTIEACACTDGSSAARVCTDGRTWTPCACHEPDVEPGPDDAAPELQDLPEAASTDLAPDLPAPNDAEGAEAEAPPEHVSDGPGDAEPLPDLPVADPTDDLVEPEPFEIQYPDNCEPQCGLRECGPDGCGGVCGTCACGHECQQGVCLWVACTGRECGLDEAGCGVQCGGCYAHANSQCDEVFGGSACGCQADCADRQCGDDGCGGSCGNCDVGVCNASGKCVPTCTPDCSGKACGPAPCGAFCGACLAGKHCSPENQCVECLSSADCTPPLSCLSMTCMPVVP